MAKKPPAFQFYIKDWRSSATVRSMPMKDRGIYIELLAAAWDSDEPGCLPLPSSVSHASFERIIGINFRVFSAFLLRYPLTFLNIDGKLVNVKLREQWQRLQRLSEERRKAAEARYGKKDDAIASHDGQTAVAVAVAVASELQFPQALEAKPLIKPLRAAKSAALPWPDGFALKPEMREYASKRGVLDADQEFEAFHDWALAHGRTYKNWEAAWRTRVNNFHKFGGNGNGTGRSNHLERTRRTLETARELLANVGEGAHEMLPALSARFKPS